MDKTSRKDNTAVRAINSVIEYSIKKLNLPIYQDFILTSSPEIFSDIFPIGRYWSDGEAQTWKIFFLIIFKTVLALSLGERLF